MDYYGKLKKYFTKTENEKRLKELESIKDDQAKVIKLYNRFKSLMKENMEKSTSLVDLLNESIKEEEETVDVPQGADEDSIEAVDDTEMLAGEGEEEEIQTTKNFDITDDMGKFFVVTQPDKDSEKDDIMLEVDVFGLASHVKNGLEFEKIQGIYKQKSDAGREATLLVKNFKDELNELEKEMEAYRADKKALNDKRKAAAARIKGMKGEEVPEQLDEGMLRLRRNAGILNEVNYGQIFKLIDKSNRNLEMGGGEEQRKAEEELVEMGIYNHEGEVISKDPKILKYYEDKWT